MIDSQLLGYYLDNWSSNAWYCFTFFFQDKLSHLPFKIQYDALPATTILLPNQKLQCKFSDILQFYSVAKNLEVKGFTNLEDYFYDRTVQIKDYNVDTIFVMSHLVTLVDAKKFDGLDGEDDI